MAKGFNSVNKGFKKGFQSVYYAKARCPACKEEIYANALVCPYCNTDFKKPPFNTRTKWQSIALKIFFIIALALGIGLSLGGVQIILAILLALATYSAGYIAVQKIQSFKNYHHK